jgi:copper chaperone
MEKIEMKIEGMSCGHCSNAVKNLLSETSGVQRAEVHLAEGRAEVEFDSSVVSVEELRNKINDTGMYKASN